MSTAHIYGDPPESLCTEDSPLGYGLAPFDGYAWERAYEKSVLPNMRKVILRTSFVLGRTGGALQRLSFIVKIGLGGKAGHGKQGISWRLSQKGDFCEGILKSVHFSGIFFWEGVTLLSYDVRILVLGSVCLVFFVWADSTPVKKYCPCFSALYLGRRFGF